MGLNLQNTLKRGRVYLKLFLYPLIIQQVKLLRNSFQIYVMREWWNWFTQQT